MDALQAYQSSDSEDEESHHRRDLSDGAAKRVNSRTSSNSDSKLPKPDLNFRSSGGKYERDTSTETSLHPMLPWGKPSRKREFADFKKDTDSCRLKSHTQELPFIRKAHGCMADFNRLHQTNANDTDSNLAFYNSQLQQETNILGEFLHLQPLGPKHPHRADGDAVASCASLESTSLAVSTGTGTGSQSSRTSYPQTTNYKTTSKRPAIHVTQPYIPKRLRQSHQESMANGSNSSRYDSSPGKLREKMYTTPSTIAHQIDRRLTSKLPKHRTLELGLHAGPVTSIRWCTPQFSHLLLSSSMDKTLRIWNGIGRDGCSLQTLNCHRGAVKDAQWGRGGCSVLSCGYDKTARLSDVESGKELQVFDHPSYATCIKTKPDDPDIFLTGTYNSSIYCWDIRTGNLEHEYKGKLGQILDVEFLPGCNEFASSCDVVSRDSANKTVMVWDLRSTAVVSNQLYHEKYTCPCLRSHPSENVFAAQSNANYIALFSTIRPYKLNKFKRYESHQLEGYQIGFDFSPDGALLASGSSDGNVYIYDYLSTRKLKSIQCHMGPCTNAAWHPILPGVMATGGWDGTIGIWQ